MSRFQGWKLEDAILHTSDVSDLDAWQNSKLAAGGRQRLLWKNEQIDGHEAAAQNARNLVIKRLRDERRRNYLRLTQELWRKLAEARLRASGRRGSPLAVLQEIPQSAWSSLAIEDLAKSVLREKTAQAIKIFDVRIFPVTDSPVADLNTLAGSKTKRVRAGATKSVHRESIEAAILALWPDGVPLGLPSGKRNQQIIDWQKSKGLQVSSEKTISRHFTERQAKPASG